MGNKLKAVLFNIKNHAKSPRRKGIAKKFFCTSDLNCFKSFVPKIGNSRLEDFSLFPLGIKFYFHTETWRKKRFTEFAFLFFLRVYSVLSVSPCENESEIFADFHYYNSVD